MKLNELYTNAEIRDESEALSHFVPMDDLDFDFTVKTLNISQIEDLLTWRGDMFLVASMRDHATPEQIDLINSMANDFDPDRCVVIDNGRVIDGYHHIMAAYQLNETVRYIDMNDVYTEVRMSPEL